MAGIPRPACFLRYLEGVSFPVAHPTPPPLLTGRGSSLRTLRTDVGSDARAKRKSDVLRTVLILLLVSTISRVHEAVPFLAVLHPGLVLFVLAVLLAASNPGRIHLGNVLASWPGRVVAALGVLSLVSAPFSLSLGGAAMYFITDFSKVLLFAFLLMAAIRTASDLRLFAWGYVVASAIIVWMALFMFGISRSIGSLVSRLGGLYTYDSNDICCVLIVGMALTLTLLQTSRGRWRWLYVLVLLGIGAAMARSGSRGGFLALLGAGSALLILQDNIQLSKRLGVVFVLGLGLLVMAPPGYWDQMQTILEPKHDYNWETIDGRRELAKRGIGYMLSYPLGVGINNFARAEGTISGKGPHTSAGTGVKWTAPHNSFVQAGAELGVPGLVLWATLVVGGVISMIRLRSRLPRAWLAGSDDLRFLYFMTTNMAVALIGFGIAAFFVSFAWLDLVYVLAAFMTGLYSILRRPEYVAARRNAMAAQGAYGGRPTLGINGPLRRQTWRG